MKLTEPIRLFRDLEKEVSTVRLVDHAGKKNGLLTNVQNSLWVLDRSKV